MNIDDLLNEHAPERGTIFPKEVFEHLPDILKGFAQEFQSEEDLSIALFAALIMCSSIMPNYYTKYANKRYGTNVFGFIFGGFGSGKGTMGACMPLLTPIHKGEYYDEKMQVPNKVASEPRLHVIPGNITKANIFKCLDANYGRGIMIETEADTMTSALRSEYGQHSDLLRAAFEHEPISKGTNSSGYTSIPELFLSLLVSGTPNQLISFIRNVENGLYSRFLYFKVVSSRMFKDVFKEASADHFENMLMRGELLNWLHDELSALGPEKIEFSFTSEQKAEFLHFFQTLKGEYFSSYGDEMDGVAHRFGVIFARIAMILSMLRVFDFNNKTLQLPSKIVCSEEDFLVTQLIIQTLEFNSHEVHSLLMQTKLSTQSDSTTYSVEKRDELIAAAIKMYLLGHNTADIAEKVLGKRSLRGTIHRWLKKAGVLTSK